MKRFSEQFNKQANHIRLQASERSDLRERLVAYMEYHPLTADAKSVSAAEVSSQAYRSVRLDLPIISKFIGAFAVLTLIVVPVFAENSVPGDILYPVKVRFNEEVRGSLTFSPYQKVEWETARLERRISEAQLLAEAGLLTPEVEAQVAEAVKGHSNAAQQEIASLGATDIAEAALAKIALNTVLEVQTEVLSKQNGNSSTTPGHSVSAIAAVIGEAKLTSAEFDSSSLPPDKLLAYVESETTRAYEYLDSVSSVASVSERNDIRRRLNDVNKTIDKAVDDEKQVTDSEALLGAVSDIRKLISFMTNIDVRENVSVEDLVPMVLTDEEHQAVVIEKTTKLNELNSLVNGRLVNLPAPLKEKVDLNLIKVAELSTAASNAVAAKNYTAAEASLNEALIIMIDLNSQTAGYESEEDVADTATSSDGQATSTENTTE